MRKYFVSLAIICILFGCSSKWSDNGAQVQQMSAGDTGKPAKEQAKTGEEQLSDANGPTVFLFNKSGGYPDNTLADFMYFVPLISPVPVSASTSENNAQGGHLLSYESDTNSDSFYVACDFRMEGDGFYINTFDKDAMVEWNIKSAGNKKVLKHILDYIKFEGKGYGRIEARGTIKGSKKTVEKVEVRFDARDAESPVTVGLYDVDVTKKKDGHYTRYNKKVARITTLKFERTDRAPKMDLNVSAVGKDEDSLGTWAHITGFFGNFFIEPIEIAPIGNNTMLEFGLSLYNKQATFTFPKAQNLKVVE